MSATHTSYLSVCVCVSQHEEAALRALEEQRMKEEKRRRQEETKADLDYSLKLKMKKRAKEVQQELALDMKLLEQMLTATTNEACLLYTSPSPRDATLSRMPSSA